MRESGDDFMDVALDALEFCSPFSATTRVLRAQNIDVARYDVLAIGKCAGPMMDAVLDIADPGRALAVVPSGYPRPRGGVVMEGEHPLPEKGSFAAGRAVLDYAASAERPILLLLSGGGSACVEVPADGIDEAELLDIWSLLLRSGLPITLINRVRRRLSAIKGGGLGRRMRHGSIVLIHSDVPHGRERDVASSPAFADEDGDRELELALASLPASVGERVRRLPEDESRIDHRWEITASPATLIEQIEHRLSIRGWEVEVAGVDALDDDVEVVAERFVTRITSAGPGTAVIAGGEPHVPVRGEGRGGRCTELAARLVLEGLRRDVQLRGLSLATDGVDGSSGTAGMEIDPAPACGLRDRIVTALSQSDTAALGGWIGRAVIMRPGGNNLRDVLLLARG